MVSTLDDAAALAGSVERPELFAVVYRKHAGAIVRYLRARLGSSAAEDAAHEVFVRAFRSRHAYEAQFPTALPWLYGIAARVIADLHRQEARQLKGLEAVVRESPRAESAAGQFGEGLPTELVVALRALSLEDRETLLLLVWGELSYAEVAAVQGVPVGTVRSRVSRAKARMRAELSPHRPTATDGEAHA